ncbi:MAG: hypothetical protein H7288_06175 [Kineosporiaceae bacterium]|nr:hypothetical protein [Aeromicrobium sp.]
MRIKESSTAKRVLASLGVLGVLGAVAGLATYAAFTSSTNGSETVTSGSVTLALGAVGATNRLSATATNVAAGDTIDRALDLVNTSSLALTDVKLTTTATTSSLLDTDTTNGLQLQVDKCSVAWTEAGTAPAYTYTCGGTTTSVVAASPVIQANTTLTNLTLAAGGGTDKLRVRLTLPSAAGNTLQSKTSTIQYAFTATQRAGTAS